MFGLFERSKEHNAIIDTGSDVMNVTVEKGQTLLNAALESGINWPHKCKVGSCGSCSARIVSGKIKAQIDFAYVLSPEALKAGYVLACQSELRSDITVKLK